MNLFQLNSLKFFHITWFWLEMNKTDHQSVQYLFSMPTEGKWHRKCIQDERKKWYKWKFSYEISIEDLIYFAINFFFIYI